MPESTFYVTGGTLRHDAPSYVERQADKDLLEGLLKGEFCYVLTSRQMGKSSLMVRTATKLREQGIAVVVLDLTAIGQNLTPEQWYDGVIMRVGRELRLENELEDFSLQTPRLSPVQRAFAALREVVLRKRTSPVVIFVDEIDTVRSLPFSTDEFFAAVRECYNGRTEDADLRRLTFCLLGVGTPSDLIRNARLTPFNIGRRIELNDFSSDEALPLAAGLECRSASPAVPNSPDLPSGGHVPLLLRVLYWTGGHPYLTQRLCQAVTQSPPPLNRATVDRCCGELFFSSRARERDDNLLFVRERLLRNQADRAALLHFCEQVLTRRGAPDDETNPLVGVLRLAGIARGDGDRMRVRNRIYARVFDHGWIAANMPDAETRRQRAAYRRGVARTASVAAVVVLAMAGLVVLALRSRAQAKNATWTALRDQARLSRASGLAGQRFGALESIRQAARIKPSPELRDEAIASLAVPDLRRRSGGISLAAEASGLVFSGDLRFYAFSTLLGETVVRAVDDNRDISRWRAEAGVPARIWFGHDYQYLALAHTNKDLTMLSFWRLSAGAERPEHVSGSPPARLFGLTNRMQLEALDFSPDDHQVAVGNEEGIARIFSLPEGKISAELDIAHPCSGLRFDPNGRWVAAANSEDLKIGVYGASSGNLIKTLHSPSPPRHLVWHPHGQFLAAAGEDHRIRLWEIEADEFPKQELPQQMSDISALAFSHSGGLLVSASADQTMCLWEPGSGRLLLTLTESGSAPQLRFSPDDRQLGFAQSGREIWFWEVASGEECRTLFDFEADELSAVALHPEGALLATAHLNGVTLWDLAHSRRLAHMSVGRTAGVRFHPISGDLVSAEFRGTYCFSIERPGNVGEQNWRLDPKEDFYLGPGAVALEFSRDADVLAVAYDDRIRVVRNTNSAYAEVGEFIGEPGFSRVAISPNGRQVAAANWKRGDVWLWDRTINSEPRRLRVEGRADLRFSPDGRWLATGTERMATLWDTRSWEPAVRVERPRGSAHPAPLAFAGNSLVWAVALTDARVRLLDLSGKIIADFEPPQKNLVVDIAFSPDGSRLTCATTAKTVLVWDLAAVSRSLVQLGLDAELKLSPGGERRETAPMTVEVGDLDRLRFSEPRHILGLRREVGDLTELIRQNPGAWQYYSHRAGKLRELGEFERAVEDYQHWIELDRNSSQAIDPKQRAWPLRDLAFVYLSGPRTVQNYQKAFELTQQALELDGENPDNHLRHGIACYRLERYQEAEDHLQACRRSLESKNKNVTVMLFYEAMCQAHRNKILAGQSLQRARETYARTNLKYRESHAGELSDLIWEAQHVVGGGGSMD